MRNFNGLFNRKQYEYNLCGRVYCFKFSCQYNILLADNKGKSTQKTGSITTTGNAPSYTATAGSATRTGFTVTPSSISYDTNANFSSFKVE